ncbi:MAG: hypothetical protein AABW56_05290 [Nanoarchaeota archaeon]
MKNDEILDTEGIETEEEEKPSIFRKVFIMILGTFLILLLVTYFSFNPLIENIFIGLVKSDKIDNNIVNINSTNKLVFQNNTYNDLLNIFDDNIEREFKVCLVGNIEDGDYYINGIYTPKTFSQTSSEVVSEFCDKDTIVDMHSHPLKHCLPSEQDFESFKLFKNINNNAIMGVMCEKGRFNFYI